MKFFHIYKPEICATDNELRPAMTRVKFCSEGLVSTDGHALTVIPCEHEDGDPESALIDKRAFVEARKTTKRDIDPHILLTTETATVRDIRNPGRTQSFDNNVSEKYPDWQSVFPKTAPKFIIALNARLLKNVADAIGSECVVLEIHSAATSISVLPVESSHSKGRGLLMPVRSDMVKI